MRVPPLLLYLQILTLVGLGNAPQLILKKNIPAGISSDVVLATFSAAADTWQRLSGTTSNVTDDAVLEFYLNCDGTAGLIYVDDWSVS